MSTNYIDNTVVSMKFDNRDFEHNVHQSLGTIDKLKKSLDFKGAADSMEELSDTIEKTDLSPLLKGLSKATDGFSALEVMGITALSRITNKAMEVGERLVKSLTIDQLSAGWGKYEQKINAVQTIMAATASTWDATAKRLNFAGTQMEFVNEQLDKLNWFSDETSYSFTDMTTNIGKFTSVGVELDKAVTAMEGISTWAAKSGVNAQNATRAYYNLAQAMSAGYVKAIDWRSIELVNMSTVEFKQTAIDTAVKMGTLKKAENGVFKTLKGGEVTVNKFSEELKDQWFTADVLTATLEEYGKAATRLSEISDEYGIYATEFLSGIEDWQEGNRDITGIANDLGISVEELLPLFEELSSEEYKLSLSAFKAAQEAKTFTEVIEATKDAVSTQWMNTWEMIFGNYEEAKELWSEMAEKFFDIFAGGGEARNNMLKKLLSDNWDALIQRINDAGIATDEFEKKLEENMRNGGVPVDTLLNTWGSLAEVFRNWPGLSHYVRETLLEMVTPLEENGKAVAETAKKLEDFQKVVNEVIRGDYKSGKARVENLTKAGWDYAEVQDLVNKVWARNGQTWKDTTITAEDLVDTLGKMTTDELKTIGFTDREVELLKDLQGELLDTDSDINTFIDNLSNKSGRTLIFESLINIVDAFALAINVVKDAWNEVFPHKNIKTLRRYLEIIHSITEWLIMNDETYDKVKRTLMGVFSVLGLIQDVITTALKIILPDLFTGVENVGGGILDVTANLGDFLVALRKFLTGGELLGNIIKYLRDMFFASVDGIKAFIEYLSELPIVGAVLEKIRDVLDKIVGFFKELWDIFYDSIIEENKTVFEAIVKVFERLAKAFKDLEEKYPILKDIKEAIGNFFNAFKDYGGDILNGLIEGLSGFNLKELKEKVVELAETIYNTFADWMGIHSPSTKFITLALNCVAGFIVGLIEGIAYVVTAVRNFAKGISDSTDKYIAENPDSPMAKLQKYIKDTLIGIKDFFIGIYDGVQQIIQNIGNKLQDIGIIKKLSDILKEMALILWFASIIYANIGVTTAIRKIGEAFEGIGDFFESWGYKNYANIAKNVAIAVGAIGFIAYLLAKLPKDQFKQAMKSIGVLSVLTAGLGWLFAQLTKFNQQVSKAGKIKTSKTDAIKNATSKIQLAGLILAIGASVYLVIDSVKKVQEMIGTNEDLFYRSIFQILTIMGVLVSVVYALNSILKTEAIGGNMLGVAAVIAAIAFCLSAVFNTLYKFFFKENNGKKLIDLSGGNWPQIFLGLGSLILIILALAAAAGIISSVGGKVNVMFGVGSALIGLAVGVYIITAAIANLNSAFMDLLKKTNEAGFKTDLEAFGILASSLFVIAGILGILIVGVSMIATMMKENWSGVLGLFSATLFISVLTLAVYALVDCIKVADDILNKAKNPLGAVGTVVGALVALVASIKIINNTHVESKSAIWTLFSIAAVIFALGWVVNSLVEQKMPNDVTKIIEQLSCAIDLMIVCAGVSSWIQGINENQGTIADAINKIAMFAGLVVALIAFGEEVYKLTALDMSDDVITIMDKLANFMYNLLVITGILIAVQGKLGSDVGTFAVAALIASMGWAIGEIGKGMAVLMQALSGDDWISKLKGVWQFLFAILLIIGIFAGVLMYVATEAGGAVLAVAAVIAAIGYLIYSIAMLLTAITYFCENEKLTDRLKDICGIILDIIDRVKEAIEWLARLFSFGGNDLVEVPTKDGKLGKMSDYFGQGRKPYKHDRQNVQPMEEKKSGSTTKSENTTNAERVGKSVDELTTELRKEKESREHSEITQAPAKAPGPPEPTTDEIVTTTVEKTMDKIYAEGPTKAVNAFGQVSKENNDVLSDVVNTGKTINKTVSNLGSSINIPGAKNGSTGIFGIGDVYDKFYNIGSTYKTLKNFDLADFDKLKQMYGEIKSGDISDETKEAFQNTMKEFGIDVGGMFGDGFGDGFSANTDQYFEKMFNGQSWDEYMSTFGNLDGMMYGQSFMTGFASAADQTAYNRLGVIDSVTSKIFGLFGGKGTDMQGFISADPNYNIFAGYSGLGGFGTQTIEFPEKMEVTSTSLENTITSQMAMLRGQINTLKNDISNIYVRLDSATIVGKLTPAISSEIYGRTVQYGRGN